MAVPLAVPSLGRSMTAGLVAEWYLPDGSAVGDGDAVYRLECDSVAVEVEADGDGVLRHNLEAGATCRPGDVAGVILAPEEFAAPACAEPRPASNEGTACETAPSPGPVPFVPRRAAVLPRDASLPPPVKETSLPPVERGELPLEGRRPVRLPSPGLATAPYLRLDAVVAEANKLCAQLRREWAASGLAPSVEDVVLRAVAHAMAESPLLAHFGDSVALSAPGAGEEQRTVLTVAAVRPFREAVAERAGVAHPPASDASCAATVISFASLGISDASPGTLPGEPVALAIGAPRTVAAFEGGRAIPAVVITLTLAYDPAWVTVAVAAGLLARVRELVEAPYALLAG